VTGAVDPSPRAAREEPDHPGPDPVAVLEEEDSGEEREEQAGEHVPDRRGGADRAAGERLPVAGQSLPGAGEGAVDLLLGQPERTVDQPVLDLLQLVCRGVLTGGSRWWWWLRLPGAQTVEVIDQISGGRPWPHGPGLRCGVPGRRHWPVPSVRPSSAPWPGRPQFALLALLALLLGYTVTHRPSLGPQVSPPRVVPPGPAQLLVSPWLGGRASTGPAGLRLLVGGANPRVVDAATGTATLPPGIQLAPGTGISAFPVGRSRIAVVGHARAAGISLLLPGVDPLILGGQSSVSPGVDGELIIATSPGEGTTVSVATAGPRVVRWQWRSPDALTVVADGPFGLVLQRSGRTADDRDLVLVNRRSGAVRQLLGHAVSAVAAGAHAAAWVPADCVQPCPLRVGDLRTGHRLTYRMPEGRRPKAGAFSPDGHSVALTFGPRGSQDPSGRVGVLDLRTGAVALVPDLHTAPELGAHLAWSPDSRWLVIGVPWPDHQRLALWRPGGAPRVLPTELPGRAGAITVLP
jgi:hypothetical protein